MWRACAFHIVMASRLPATPYGLAESLLCQRIKRRSSFVGTPQLRGAERARDREPLLFSSRNRQLPAFANLDRARDWLSGADLRKRPEKTQHSSSVASGRRNCRFSRIESGNAGVSCLHESDSVSLQSSTCQLIVCVVSVLKDMATLWAVEAPAFHQDVLPAPDGLQAMVSPAPRGTRLPLKLEKKPTDAVKLTRSNCIVSY